jgi:hypothetical protein
VNVELKEKIRDKLRRQQKLGESERTHIAEFLLVVLDEEDTTELGDLLDECDELASAAAAAKADLQLLAGQ